MAICKQTIYKYFNGGLDFWGDSLGDTTMYGPPDIGAYDSHHGKWLLTITDTTIHGTTIASGTFSVGMGIATPIIAVPDPGYHFVNWTMTVGDGKGSFADANSASTTVTVNYGDVTVQANFADN